MKRQQQQGITQSSVNTSLSQTRLESRTELPQQIPSDMEFIFGFNVSTSQIVDLFTEIVQEMKYDLIQSEQTHATAIKHGKKSFMQVIDCFNWWTQGSVTAIKMTIVTREKDSKRICRIRGLVGARKQVRQFIQKFKNRSSKLMQSKQQIPEQQQLDMPEQQTNPFYLQSCAAYMFHKILANQKYGIGNLLHSSINNFKNEYQDEKKCAVLLPQPMKKAVNIVQQVVNNLYKDFNYGRHQMQQIMPYCRISVQKYVFEKIHDTIQALYSCKNQQTVNAYIEKKKKILTTLSPASIFKQIGLSQKFWLVEPTSPQLQKVGSIMETKAAQEYKKASREMQRILGTQSPREKVKHCQIMYTILKTVVFEQTPGHQQLFNMQDIIPLLILILLLTNIDHIKNELDFMVDFIGFDPCDLEGQRRLLVNLSESFNYVSRDWKIV